MKLVSPALLIAALVAAASSTAHAEVPSVIPFAGRLADDNGPIPDGAHTFTFRLYDTQEAGTGNAVWMEQFTNVDVEDGLVYARLGSTEGHALDATVLDGRRLFLEIVYDNTTIFSPRLALESVPYAVHAGTADTIGGLEPEDLQPAITGDCAGGVVAGIGANGVLRCEADDNSGGTVQSVTAGTGLTGGGSGAAVSLAVDPTRVQSRVTGSCPSGQYLRAIAADGTVTCATDVDTDTDTNTTYTAAAGGGVAISGTQLGLAPCTSGQVLKAGATPGTWSCAADSSNAGTITSVVAGTGLNGGASSGAATLSVDSAYVQRRVSGACAVGESIRSIAADGTVTCEPKAPRTFFGTVDIPRATYNGTPSNWTTLNYFTFDLEYGISNRYAYRKPNQAVEARLCLIFTDSGDSSTPPVHLRLRRNAGSEIYFTGDYQTTFSGSNLPRTACSAWAPVSTFEQCSWGFPSSCALEVKHDQARLTIIDRVFVEVAGVN
jgi:hypothetical protein